MKITALIAKRAENPHENKLPTIAFLGDSVTQGCFEIYQKNDGSFETVFDSENGYPAKVKKLLSLLYPQTPVHIINAGISGDSAPGGLDRLERDVLVYNPDLVIVSYGLNDMCGGAEKLETYKTALSEIFDKIIKFGAEIIFMTPNLTCTQVSCHIKYEELREFSKMLVELNNNKTADKYMDAAKDVCRCRDVPVCDCYEKWKLLAKNGVETTELLANYLNHPNRDMDWLFAASLIDVMMRETDMML